MPKQARMFAALAATGALLALPATGLATKPADPGKPDDPGSQGKTHKPADKGKPADAGSKGKAKSCAKTHTVSYNVSGTFVSAVADNPATPASEASVTITVTSANSHAAKSGEIADMDAAKTGVQVKGATYTVAAGDAYVLKLDGYETPDTPSAGDKVKIKGKIAVTKKRCAAAGTSTADRYAKPDVTKVTISDRDPDA